MKMLLLNLFFMCVCVHSLSVSSANYIYQFNAQLFCQNIGTKNCNFVYILLDSVTNP